MKDQHKDSVLNTLVANHPLVKALKLEAKKYKKEKTHLGLMQAQSEVAQKKGFHNWHDFLQKIKLIFNHDFKHNQLISAEKGIIPEHGYLHLGHSQSYGLEQWISENMLRTHLSLFDTSLGLHSPDVYLAKQIIQKKESLVFISEDLVETEFLAQKAIENDFSEHLYIIDYTQNINTHFHDYLASFNALEHQSSGALTELLFNLVSQNQHFDEYLKGRILSFISVFAMTLHYIHLEKGNKIQWADLLENVTNYLQTSYSILPLHLQNIIDNYFNSVTKEMSEQIQQIYTKALEPYLFLQEQKNRCFSLIQLREMQQPYVALILLPKRAKIKDTPSKSIERFYNQSYFQIYHLFFSYLKSVMAFELGISIEQMPYMDIIENKRQKSRTLVIMRDIQPIHGCAVLPAQMRSAKIGLVFSYSEKIHDYFYEEEKKSLLLNTNLKIFSHDIKKSALYEYYENILSETQLYKDYSFINQAKMGEYYLYHQESIQVLKIIHP